MTPLQECILDRLIGADKIGVLWNSGPLGLAVKALKERKLTGRRDAAQALGYPMMLCHALQGASSVLPSVDDRRRLAMSVFATVPPRDKAPRLTPRRHVEIALWCARWVHPLVCREDCPFFQEIAVRAESYLAGGRVGRPFTVGESACAAGRMGRSASSDWSTTPKGYAVATCYRVLEAAADASHGTWPGMHSNLAGRDAARVCARAQGTDAAVEFCLELARELGMIRRG